MCKAKELEPRALENGSELRMGWSFEINGESGERLGWKGMVETRSYMAF